MSSIDNRIVYMQFNNNEFERNAKQSIDTLDKLKMALNFKGVTNAFNDVFGNKAGSAIAEMVKSSERGVNKLEEMWIGSLRRIGEQITNTGERFIKSLSVDQISSGFEKYETEVGSVQTIMNATGKSIEEVQEQLDKLMWFTDETSYSFSDMTSNIGKFTSAGVDLDKATEAMMGISNWAALAGQGTNEASRAMYNLSQAMSVGVVKLMDWRSIENANMATTEFKQSVIDSAVALGTLKREGKGLYSTMKDNEVSVTNFNEALSDGWFTSEVLLKTLRQYNEYTEEVYRVTQSKGVSAAEAMELIGDSFKGSGEKAFRAAQEAKTFTDAINAVKDAVSTGWLKTFDLVFGNYVEAKGMWTTLANQLWETFASGGEYRNEQLEAWRDDFDGRSRLVVAFIRLVDTFNYRLGLMRETMNSVFGNVWDAGNLDSLTSGIERFVEKLVSTQHVTYWFLTDLKPFFGAIKDIAEGVGFLLQTAYKQLEAWRDDFDGRSRLVVAFIRLVDTFNYRLGIMRETMNSVFGNVWNVWNAGNLDSLTSGIERFVEKLVSTQHVTYWFLTDLKPFFGAIKDIAEGVGFLLQTAYKQSSAFFDTIASNPLFDYRNLNDIQSMAKAFRDFAEAMASDESNLWKFRVIGGQVAGILSQLASAIRGVYSGAKGSISEVFGPIDIYNTLSRALNWIAARLTAIRNAFSGMNRGQRIFKGILSAARILAKVLIALVQAVGPHLVSFVEYIAPIILEAFAKMGDALTELSNGDFSGMQRGFDVLSSILTAVGKAAEFVRVKVVSFFEALKDLTGRLSESKGIQRLHGDFDLLGDSISSIFKSKSGEDAVRTIRTITDGTKSIETSFDFVGLVADAIDGVADAIANLIEILPSAISTINNLFGAFQNGNENAEQNTSFFDRLREKIANLFTGFDADTLMQNAAHWAGTILTGFAQGLSEIDFEKVKGLSLFFGLIISLIQMNKLLHQGTLFMDSLKKIPLGIGDFINNINGVVKSVKGVADQVKKSIADLTKVQQLTAFTWALVSLVGAVILLSMMPREDIARGLVYLGIIAIIIKALTKEGMLIYQNEQKSTKTFGNINVNVLNSKQFGIATMIASIAFLMLSIVSAIKLLKDFDSGDLAPGFSAILVFFITLGLFLYGLAAVQKKYGVEQLSELKLFGKAGKDSITTTIVPKGIVPFLLAMAIAIKMVAGVIKSLGSMEITNLEAGLFGLVSIMGLLFAFTAGVMGFSSYLNKKDASFFKEIGKTLILLGASLVILSVAVAALVPSIAVLGMLGKGNILAEGLAGLYAIVAVFAIFSIITRELTKFQVSTKTLLLTATSFVILAAAVNLMLPALAILTLLPSETRIWSAVGSLSAMLLAMGTALALGGLTNRAAGDSNGVIKTALAFLIFAAAMGAVAAVIAKLSTGEYSSGFQNFAIAIAMFVGSLLLLTGITYLLSNIANSFEILQALAFVLGGAALLFAAFGAGMWLVGKALPPIVEYLPQLGIALAEFLTYLDDHWSKILLLMGSIVVVSVVIGAALWGIFKTAGGFFSAMSTLLKGAGEKFGKLPDKTKAIVVSIVLSIIAGLAVATPEAVKAIGDTIVKVLGYLGQLVGPVVDGLFVLIIQIIHGLADALRNNSGALVVAIADVAEALLEVIMDALFAIIKSANNLEDVLLDKLDDLGGIWSGIATVIRKNPLNLIGDETVDAMRLGMDDVKNGLRSNLDDLADYYQIEVNKKVDETGDSFGKSVADKISSIVGGINATDSMGNKLDLTKILMPDGGFDTSAFDSLKEQFGAGMINMDQTSFDALNNISLNYDDMANGVVDMNDILDQDLGETWGNFADTASTGSDEAKAAVEGNVDDTLNYLTDKKTTFYQAGYNLMMGLRDGINQGYYFVQGAIVSKANAMNNAFTSVQREHSPSRVWMQFGSYMMEGLANGINNSANNAVNAVTTIANMVNNAFNEDSEYVPTIRPVVDMSSVMGASGSVNGFFATQSMTLSGINGTLEAQGADLREQMNQNRIYNDSNVLASMAGLRSDINTLAGAMSEMQVVMDTGATVGALAPGMDKALGVRANLKGRRN